MTHLKMEKESLSTCSQSIFSKLSDLSHNGAG